MKTTAGRYFIEKYAGRSVEEIEMLTKDLDVFSDDELSQMLLDLDEIFQERFKGACYKRDARVLKNKIRLIGEYLQIRNARALGVL